MLDDLGIKGIRPIDDRPNGQPKNHGSGKKFSLEGEEEEKEKKKEKKRKKPRAPAGEEKEGKPSITRREDGGIDILI